MLKKHEGNRRKLPKSGKWIKAKADTPVAKAAKRSLKPILRAVRRYLVLAARHSGEDTEYVHQLRVASRRVQATLELYSDLIPNRRAKRLNKKVKRLRKATNDARDLDVFMQHLASDQDNEAARMLFDIARKRRCQAQEELAKVYDRLRGGKRLKKQAGKVIAEVRQRGKLKRWKKKRLGSWGKQRLQETAAEFFQAADADFHDVSALHQFRIRGKKLRYAIELLAEAFPRALRKEIYPEIKEIQDLLGDINDHAVAAQRLADWLDRTEDPTIRAYLQQGAETEQRQLEQAQREFIEWWTPARRKCLEDQFHAVLN